MAELVGRARAAGVERMATVGTDGASIQARAHRGRGSRRGRRDRRAPSARDLGFDELARGDRARGGAPARPRDRRDRARLLPRPRPARRPAAAFEAQLELAARFAAGRDPHARPRTTRSRSCASTPARSRGDPALLLGAGPLAESVERGYLCSFAGNVTYPKATDLQPPPASCRASCCSWRPTRPISPQPVREAERAANVAHTARFVAELRGVEYDELERSSRRTPSASSGRERPAAPGLPAPAPSIRHPAKRSSARTSSSTTTSCGHRRRGRARPGRCRAGGRRRARRPVGVPRAPRRLFARRGGRPLARGAAARGARPVRERDPSPGGRRDGLRRARAESDQGRREPAVRRRRRCCSSRSPSCRAPGSGSRWSSARSRIGSPPRPAARATARPRCSRSSRATCASCGRSRGPSSTRAERGLGAGAAPARARAAPRARGARARRLRPPAQGAGRVAGPDAGRDRRHPRGRRTALEELGHPADARAERLTAEDWPRLADALGTERLAGLRPRTA